MKYSDILNYFINRYKTQELCEKAAAAFQPGLKLVPDWFITNNMLDDLDNDVIINDEIDLEMMILIILHSLIIALIMIPPLITL